MMKMSRRNENTVKRAEFGDLYDHLIAEFAIAVWKFLTTIAHIWIIALESETTDSLLVF